MIPQELINKVEDKVLEVYCNASEIYNRDFDIPQIVYDLKGTCAGQLVWNAFNGYKIRFNSVLLIENEDTFINRTIPHEIAHHINRIVNGHSRSVKPHGKEWKSVIMHLGYDASRCHTYDVSNSAVKKNTKRHLYKCLGCGRTHNLSTTKHNRMINYYGNYYRYRCGICKGEIRFIKTVNI